MNLKIKTAKLSVVSNSLLIAMKLVAGIVSGSVSIISEAIHSSMDLIAAVIAFFAVKFSDNPPDEKHPYGHGKIENVSGVIEGILILIAAVLIITEGIKKLLGEPIELESIGLGLAVMLISAVVNLIVSGKLYKAARETGSIALEADALHLRTDVYTSLGVAAGLGLIMLTGVKWLDPLIAIGVALFIIKESIALLSKAFRPLLDESWPAEDVEKLENILKAMNVNYHDLRTRIAGNYRFIDLHVEISKDLSVEDAHSHCDRIEEGLKSEFERLNVTIHVEPSG